MGTDTAVGFGLVHSGDGRTPAERAAARDEGLALQAGLRNGKPPRPVSDRRIFMEDEAQDLGCGPGCGCLPWYIGLPMFAASELLWAEYQWLKRRWQRRRERRDLQQRSPGCG